jgi:UDP-GlcNAc:undecaprenyl-phosphate GlcNAc-1-phosphate transferase
MTTLLPLLCASTVLAILTLAVLMRLPLAKHFADMPDHRKVHQSAIPRLGGLGIVLTLILFLAVAQGFGLWDPSDKLLYSLSFVGAFMLLAGTLDDVFSLGYKIKFLLQFVLAGVVVCVFRLHFQEASIFGQVWYLGGFGMVVSMFWIVALINAVNIIDGIDGLAAVVTISGLAGIGALAHADGAAELLAVCVATSGATLGFLYHNLQRRRKIFLGDTGSQFLGAMLGVLTLSISEELPSVGHSVLIPLLLVGYPVLDTSVAMARRFLKVRHRDLGHRVTRMFLADNDHLHHRLVYSGLSHLQSTFLLMLLASGFAVTAVVLPRVSWQGEVAIMAYLFLAVAFILNRLGFIQRGSVRRALRAWILGGVFPEGRHFARHHARYYEIFSLMDNETRPLPRKRVPAPEFAQETSASVERGAAAQDF